MGASEALSLFPVNISQQVDGIAATTFLALPSLRAARMASAAAFHPYPYAYAFNA
jgi:hypothetical protein